MIRYIKNNQLYLLLLLFPIGILVGHYPIGTLIGTIVFFVTIIILVLMISKTELILSKIVSLLILSLFLFPGIDIGGISFRLDDYLAIFMTVGLSVILFNRKAKYSSLTIFNWLIVYLIYSFFITLVNILFNDLNPILILYFIKEIQYFIYFFIVYFIVKKHNYFEEKVRVFFGVAAIITLGWGILQLITGNIIGYYGIGIISVSAPSQSGVVLFITSLFLYYMSLIEKKKTRASFLTIAALIAMALTFATISRTAISVLLGIIFIYLFISIFRYWNFKKIFIGLCSTIVLSPLSIILIGDDLGYSILERFSRFGQGASGRIGFWKGFLDQSSKAGLFFGNGKGYMQEIVGTFTLKADSQYVRLILEVGVIGLILWILMIISILIFGVKQLKTYYYDSLFLILLTISFIIIGITQEGYLVSIQGSLYWILTGYFIGNIVRKNSLEQDSIKH